MANNIQRLYKSVKSKKNSNLLILGATGLIGSALFKYFSLNTNFNVFGTLRDSTQKIYFPNFLKEKLIDNMYVGNISNWEKLFKDLKPTIVINCIGVTKHFQGGDDPLILIPINSYFPHYLNTMCTRYNSRLIQVSTDCVFSGTKGSYSEMCAPDAFDFYGRSKVLGEIFYSSALSIRTSTIGHELNTSLGLLEWFLSQKNSCHGFKNAFFSGLTTLELAKVIMQFIIPNPQLTGLYHIGGKKISKFNLLTLIAREYDKKIKIIPNLSFKIDRSLDSSQFYKATGYQPPSWPHLIKELRLNK